MHQSSVGKKSYWISILVWTGQEPEDETSFNGNEDYQPADG